MAMPLLRTPTQALKCFILFNVHVFMTHVAFYLDTVCNAVNLNVYIDLE